jgi:uncharacterized protein (DUF433 family)
MIWYTVFRDGAQGLEPLAIVEEIPGKAGGQPVVKGTRILADIIVEEFDSGSSIEEIEENYPKLNEETIRALVAFAHSRKPQPQL